MGSTRVSELRRTSRVTRPTTRALEADVRPRRQRGGGSAQRGRRRGDDNSTSFAYTLLPVGRDQVGGDNNVLAKQMYDPDWILVPSSEAWASFITTFLPD